MSLGWAAKAEGVGTHSAPSNEWNLLIALAVVEVQPAEDEESRSNYSTVPSTGTWNGLPVSPWVCADLWHSNSRS